MSDDDNVKYVNFKYILAPPEILVKILHCLEALQDECVGVWP